MTFCARQISCNQQPIEKWSTVQKRNDRQPAGSGEVVPEYRVGPVLLDMLNI